MDLEMFLFGMIGVAVGFLGELGIVAVTQNWIFI